MKNRLVFVLLMIIVFVFFAVGVAMTIRDTGGLEIMPNNKINQPIEEPVVDQVACASAGERSVSNFDMTKGKINPDITPIECCPGLVSIDDKRVADDTGRSVCAIKTGAVYNLCSPCGNGRCDIEYEDVCNCPQDCKK